MVFSQLKKSLGQRVLPCYCIYGEDTFLKNNALSQLKARVENPAMNISVYNVDGKTDTSALLTEMNTLPWGGEYRLVQLNVVGKCDFLYSYLANPNPRCIVALYYEKDTPETELRTIAETVVCEKLEAAYIARYLEQMGRECDTSIEREACQLLIDYLDGNMTNICAEAEKLFGLAMGGLVTKELVVANVKPRPEYKIFDISEAITNRDANKVYTLLSQFRDDEIEEGKIFGTLFTEFRRMLHVMINSDQPDSHIAAKLSVKEGAVLHLRTKVKRFTPMQLLDIVGILSDAEFKSKNGQSNMNSQIEALISQILTI